MKNGPFIGPCGLVYLLKQELKNPLFVIRRQIVCGMSVAVVHIQFTPPLQLFCNLFRCFASEHLVIQGADHQYWTLDLFQLVFYVKALDSFRQNNKSLQFFFGNAFGVFNQQIFGLLEYVFRIDFSPNARHSSSRLLSLASFTQ